MEQSLLPIGELLNSKTVARKSWEPLEEVKLIKPEEWDGAYEISCPMIMKRDKLGSWGIWCNCTPDILATDWFVVN